MAILVVLGLVAGYAGVLGSLSPVLPGTHARAATLLPALNGSRPPNVTLSGTNGSLSVTAALYYNETPSVFNVQATVGWSGGGPGDTLIVGFASQAGTSGNRSVNGATGTGRFFFNLTETEVDEFSATLYNLTNGTYVSVDALVTTVVPTSSLSLTFNAINATVSGVATTQFGWVVFGAVPPYRVTLTYGDGTWASFANQTPGYGGCRCGGNVSDHTYPTVNTTTTYVATATVQDSSGLNLTRSIPVQPSYNVQTGTSGGGGYPITFSANTTNGSATMYVWGTETVNSNSSCSCLLALTVNVSLRTPTYNGTDSVVFSFGDGQSSNQTGSGSWFRAGTSHRYTSAGTMQLAVIGQDGAGRVLSTYTNIVVPPASGNGSGGNGSNSTPWAGFHLYATNGSFGFVVNGTEWLFNSTNASYGTTYSVLLDANVTIFGGSRPYSMGIRFGDGANFVGNLSGGTAVVSHLYTTGGNYSFIVAVTDANGTTLSGRWTIVVPFGATRGNGTPYPGSVSVVVDATPVTGAAPLTVTYSALINGGSAPFTVQWSLPGGNLSANATGLAATQNYSTAGWYPATAFVYNTTSSYGTVLVGYGSVWVDVTGPAGNGSGNGSGHHPVAPPSEGGTRVGGGGVPSPMTYGLLPVLVGGAVVGIVAGYALGNRRRPPPYTHSGPVRAEPERVAP